MSDWIDGLKEIRAAGGLGVLVTVLNAKGSTPRDSGTKMLVDAKAIFGTVGGGTLEYRASEIAREMLAETPAPPRIEHFPLGPSLGQCCGGATDLMFETVGAETDTKWIEATIAARAAGTPSVLVTAVASAGGKLLVSARKKAGGLAGGNDAAAVSKARAMVKAGETTPAETGGDGAARFLFEPILPPDFQIVLFGAGHVGRALVAVLAGLPCRVTWIDSREDQLPESPPANVTVELTDAPEYEVDEAPAGSYFLVMTHSHGLDFRIGERILRRGDFRYFGLIGSDSKRERFVRNLRRKGMGEEEIGRLTSPIGDIGIPGKRPGEIAVAVAAELLQVRAIATAREAPTIEAREAPAIEAREAPAAQARKSP